MSERLAVIVLIGMVATLPTALAAPQVEYLDPTRPAGWRAPVVAQEAAEQQPDDALKLQGTFSVAGIRSAIISGRRVAVGDVVSGAEVVEIEKNRVVLKRDGETVELASATPSVKAPAENGRGLQ